MNPQISIIVPLFNEEAVFPALVERLDHVLTSIVSATEVVLVDDGSLDSTATLIKNKCHDDERYTGIILSRNFGHQLAVSAGMKAARCTEAAMIIDGDLQDPPELASELLAKFREGNDVVYAIRRSRKEHPLKLLAYRSYYSLMKRLSYIEIPADAGDFAMLSRRVINVINDMPEQSRYLRGMRAWVGFRQTGFEYERSARADGVPKYTLKKLFELAYNGIFNFSEIPIKLITSLGIFSISLCLAFLTFTLYMKVMHDAVPQGFTAQIVALTLFSGVQLVSLGIIGEYVMRIFFEVKKRPLFIVKEKFNMADND